MAAGDFQPRHDAIGLFRRFSGPADVERFSVESENELLRALAGMQSAKNPRCLLVVRVGCETKLLGIPDIEQIRDYKVEDFPMESVEPSCARKLVEQAVNRAPRAGVLRQVLALRREIKTL